MCCCTSSGKRAVPCRTMIPETIHLSEYGGSAWKGSGAWRFERGCPWPLHLSCELPGGGDRGTADRSSRWLSAGKIGATFEHTIYVVHSRERCFNYWCAGRSGKASCFIGASYVGLRPRNRHCHHGPEASSTSYRPLHVDRSACACST